jgi:hypothetical protein
VVSASSTTSVADPAILVVDHDGGWRVRAPTTGGGPLSDQVFPSKAAAETSASVWAQRAVTVVPTKGSRHWVATCGDHGLLGRRHPSKEGAVDVAREHLRFDHS